jgi:biotin transport system substrate-specific component
MDKQKQSVLNICLIALFTAIMVVCAQIAIPLPGGVPFTLQTWAIALAGVVLGPKHGTIATLLYIALGAVGAPVFAGWSGGLAVIVGRTGGFILSFPLISLLAGLGAHMGRNRSKLIAWVTLSAGLILGTAINLFIGMVYFDFVMQVGWPTAFAWSVAPFLVSSVLRIVFVAGLGKSITFALGKAGVRR